MATTRPGERVEVRVTRQLTVGDRVRYTKLHCTQLGAGKFAAIWMRIGTVAGIVGARLLILWDGGTPYPAKVVRKLLEIAEE